MSVGTGPECANKGVNVAHYGLQATKKPRAKANSRKKVLFGKDTDKSLRLFRDLCKLTHYSTLIFGRSMTPAEVYGQRNRGPYRNRLFFAAPTSGLADDLVRLQEEDREFCVGT